MKSKLKLVIFFVLCCFSFTLSASEDQRQLVKLPEMMQTHMLSNMRNHLYTINEILNLMGKGELDKAADLAESNLGMSSLDKHGASHLAMYMPKAMQKIGTGMHHAASRFALKAQEGDALAAYKSLGNVTAKCVECHAGYRIR